MIVYRLSKQKYRDDLSGIGAELYGSRWNSKGRRIIYTSESRALCTTEIAVHVPLSLLPEDYCLQTIELPKSRIHEIKIDHLNSNWKRFPHDSATKKNGDLLIKENKLLILKVPSAVVQDEFNYLLNPYHNNFNKVQLIKVEEFKFDKRLFGY